MFHTISIGFFFTVVAHVLLLDDSEEDDDHLGCVTPVEQEKDEETRVLLSAA